MGAFKLISFLVLCVSLLVCVCVCLGVCVGVCVCVCVCLVRKIFSILRNHTDDKIDIYEFLCASITKRCKVLAPAP